MGEVQVLAREGDCWLVLFQVPQLPIPTSPTCCPAFKSHRQEVFLFLPMSPVVVHYRSSSMAAEVREWVTSKGSEEVAAASPDYLSLKVTVVSHLHPEDGVWTAHVSEHCNLWQCHCLQGEAK